MDPQTKLHQIKAFNNAILSAENAQALHACVKEDDNRNLTLSQKLWFNFITS